MTSPASDTRAAAAFTIERFDVFVFRAPADPPVQTSFGIMRDRPAVLVRLTDADGTVGWGEIWCNFPTVGAELFPGMRNENNQLGKFIEEGGKVFACRLGLALHGAREEDLMEGVIPCHPLDMQDAMIEYSRKGAIINTTWMF